MEEKYRKPKAKIIPWSNRAIRAAKVAGIRNSLVAATGYSEDYISHCLHGRVRTPAKMAASLSDRLGFPAHEFGQGRAKA